MFRGSTPTHTFVLSENIGTLSNVQITYSQHDVVKVVKYLSDCTIVDEHTLSLKLTQSETLLLQSGDVVEIQIKALSKGNDVFLSDVMNVGVRRCLNDKEIS